MTNDPHILFAPCKLNLALHITGRRSDEYHTLSSLIVPVSIGDKIQLESAKNYSLTITGAFKQDLAKEHNNSVTQALQLCEKIAGKKADFSITLEKNTPIAAGLGGGSSDAAALLRFLTQKWNIDTNSAEFRQALLSLGAEMPFSFMNKPALVTGIGEALAPVSPLPPFYVVIANSGKAMPTPLVFKHYKQSGAPFSQNLRNAPATLDKTQWIDWLCDHRNDLTSFAASLDPAIDTLIGHLSKMKGCLLARMSGSGGSVFGLFEHEADARQAAQSIQKENAAHWAATGHIIA